MHIAIVLGLAWGALTFAGVYPWGYIPLAAWCAAIGVFGLVRRPVATVAASHAGVPRGLRTALLAVGAAIALQLVPLPRAWLSAIAPGTDRLLQQLDLGYAARVAGEAGPGTIFHPLSIAPGSTLLALALFAAFAIFILGCARGLRAAEARALVPALLVFAVLLAFIGIIQRAVGGDLVYGVWKTRGGPFGPFINRNHFAGWMLMALPLALGYFVALVVRGMRGAKPGWHGRLLWFSTREASRATLTGFSILPLGLALVLTLSRSGISCFAAALVLTGAIVVTRRGGGARRVALTGYLAFVGTTALVWAGLDAVAARFAEMPGSDFGGRWQAWQDTWQIIVRHPIFGTGMGTYGDVMFVFQTSNPIERFVQAHNDYLNILADGGLLVALPVAALIFVITREIRRRFREDTPDATTWWIRAGAVTGLVAIALQEVVEFSLQMPANAALFAVLVAIAVGRLPHRRAFGPRAAGH